MAKTWDMYTSGDNAGQLIRPLQYTATDDDTTRVVAYLKLATPVGSYKYNTADGLDYERMLDAATGDEERAALVTDLLLDVPRVLEVVDGPTVEVIDGDNGQTLDITVTLRTETGVITLGG